MTTSPGSSSCPLHVFVSLCFAAGRQIQPYREDRDRDDRERDRDELFLPALRRRVAERFQQASTHREIRCQRLGRGPGDQE